jgi:hypothetical protein
VNLTELFAALGDWGTESSPLIGVPETQEIEFKMAPYRLTNDGQKLEFAKDIAAMANGGGGVIVIGIETRRDESIGHDVSHRVRPVAPATVNSDAMHAVARDWVYPPLRDLEIRDWPGTSTEQLLVSVRVPPFHESPGFALVRAAEIGDRVDRRQFTVVRRSGGYKDYFTPAEVYEWIRRGRSGVLPGGPEGPLTGEDQAAHQATVEEQFQRARSILQSEEWPTFVLQAWTQPPAHVDRMHDADGVRSLLREPPSLRSSGFNFHWWGGSGPDVEPDGSLRMLGGNRGTFWLTPSGILTVAAQAGPELLGWAMHTHSSAPLINPLTLIELTYEFCHLYLRTLAPFFRPPQGATLQTLLRIALLDARRPEPTLLPRGRPTFAVVERSSRAPGDDLVETVSGYALGESTDPAVVAAELLKRFYGRFGLGREQIPFLVEDGSAVDTEGIASVQ